MGLFRGRRRHRSVTAMETIATPTAPRPLPAAHSPPGVVIAAPASGSGKTTVTLGLLRALARQGRLVASAKVGPDFIDPRFHEAASGRPCLNLDGWAMGDLTCSAGSWPNEPARMPNW